MARGERAAVAHDEAGGEPDRAPAAPGVHGEREAGAGAAAQRAVERPGQPPAGDRRRAGGRAGDIAEPCGQRDRDRAQAGGLGCAVDDGDAGPASPAGGEALRAGPRDGRELACDCPPEGGDERAAAPGGGNGARPVASGERPRIRTARRAVEPATGGRRAALGRAAVAVGRSGERLIATQRGLRRGRLEDQVQGDLAGPQRGQDGCGVESVRVGAVVRAARQAGASAPCGSASPSTNSSLREPGRRPSAA